MDALDARRFMSPNIRQAQSSEAELLTELALRSKGHWGYDAEFLNDCRADIAVSPAYIASSTVFLAEEDGRVVGFYSLSAEGGDVELMHLFVEPSCIGRGFGKLLFTHSCETARRLGYVRLIIGSDPYALRFYEAMGAVRVGEVASPIRKGRFLPLLHYSLNPTGIENLERTVKTQTLP